MGRRVERPLSGGDGAHVCSDEGLTERSVRAVQRAVQRAGGGRTMCSPRPRFEVALACWLREPR